MLRCEHLLRTNFVHLCETSPSHANYSYGKEYQEEKAQDERNYLDHKICRARPHTRPTVSARATTARTRVVVVVTLLAIAQVVIAHNVPVVVRTGGRGLLTG